MRVKRLPIHNFAGTAVVTHNCLGKLGHMVASRIALIKEASVAEQAAYLVNNSVNVNLEVPRAK